MQILASDGVWEFVSSEVCVMTILHTALTTRTHHTLYHVICIQEAVSIVGMFLEEGATTACQELIAAAMMRWEDAEGDYRDDVRYTYMYIYIEGCVQCMAYIAYKPTNSCYMYSYTYLFGIRECFPHLLVYA